ncbi:MAG: hypothetical protein ACYC0C_03485 [Devosia sp.]
MMIVIFIITVTIVIGLNLYRPGEYHGGVGSTRQIAGAHPVVGVGREPHKIIAGECGSSAGGIVVPLGAAARRCR